MVKKFTEAMPVKLDDDDVMEIDITPETCCDKVVVNGGSEYRNGISLDFDLVLKNTNGSNLDVNSFISSCKDTVIKNCQQDVGSLIKDIDFTITDTSGIFRQAEETALKLSKFVSSHNFLFKTPINHLQNHPYLRAVNRSSFGSNRVQSKLLYPTGKEPTVTDGLEILSTVTASPKVNLPPAGELVRSNVEVGARIWAMKTSFLGVWIKGIVTYVRDTPPEKLFKVRYDHQKTTAQKFYSAKQIAFEKNAEVIVPVGTRIIARYTDAAGRSAHYAGIIAEPPKVTNNKRYLIFFDDGCAQYVKHEDIYVVCTQSVDVADDVHENIGEFVRAYLQQYPERPMVKLQKSQMVKTEYNCEWSDAKVIEVDCSMVKMLFLSSQRTEWIYRGSTRLKPLRSELANAEAHRLEGKNRRRHTAAPRKPDQPYVEYTREEDIVVIDSDSDDNSYPVALNTGIKKKNTARKSLATRPLTTLNVRLNNPVFRVPDKKSHLGYKEMSLIKGFVRSPFFNHDCGIECREKDNPARHKGKNPLLIPIYLGWERQLRRFRACGPGPRVVVTYRAPCGRHLRNLEDVENYLHLVESRVTIDLFSFNTDLVLFRTFRPKEVFYHDLDVTQSRENVPVPCVNSLNDSPPPYVEYAAERFPGEGVYLNLDPNFLCGCSCTDNCQDASKCECQKINNGKYNNNFGTSYYNYRRLTEPIISGIYECNQKCKCNSQCGNRVIQNGLTVRLQMFKTQFKGWGIRCLDDIDAGQFICIYAGQLLTEQGADADGKECGDEYLAELDHIEVVEKNKEGYESDVPEFTMDWDNVKEETKEELKEETISSDDNYNSDSDVVYADSDSECGSSNLRSTANSTYATRSRQKNGRKESNPSADAVADLLASEDSSNSSHDSSKQNSQGLPDISTNLDSFRISVRELSPESSEALDKVELKRKPRIPNKYSSMEIDPIIKSDPDGPIKCEPLTDSENATENKADIKSELKTDSESNTAENSADEKCEFKKESESATENPADEESTSQRVVAKKSGSMKNPMSSSYDYKDNVFKSVRNYLGEDSLYIMDAKSKGNIGRYLNHSCEPNVFVQNVFVDTHDLRFPSVAFFAQNSIDAGTELTWDYNYEVGSVADKVMYCYCEAPSCRGRLL